MSNKNKNNQPESIVETAKVADEPTSDKLTEIRVAIAGAWDKEADIPARTAEKVAIMSEIIKLQGQEKAELANIEKVKRDLEAKEKDNARVAELDALLDMYKGLNDNSTDEQKDAFKTERERIVNGYFLGRKSSNSTVSSNASGVTVPQGQTSSKIKELIIELCEGGASVSDAVKALHDENGEYKLSRGTVGAVRTAMKKAGELERFGEKAD